LPTFGAVVGAGKFLRDVLLFFLPLWPALSEPFVEAEICQALSLVVLKHASVDVAEHFPFDLPFELSL
jgi:hypothetical protein